VASDSGRAAAEASASSSQLRWTVEDHRMTALDPRELIRKNVDGSINELFSA
jgi:hypothetical protein